MSPKTLLGFDATSIGQSGTIGINNYFLMLTHFPKKEGFFIRAGAGLSVLPVNVDTLDALETVSGFGILGGLGYAFWLGKSFNLTLNIDHSRIHGSFIHPHPRNPKPPGLRPFTWDSTGIDFLLNAFAVSGRSSGRLSEDSDTGG